MTANAQFLYERVWVNEGSGFYFTTTLTNVRGAVLPSTQVATLTLTLMDPAGNVLFAVDRVNIKNTGRGAINTAGKFDLTLTPSDTAIVDQTRPKEMRRALIEYTDTGGGAGKFTVDFMVRNLARVP